MMMFCAWIQLTNKNTSDKHKDRDALVTVFFKCWEFFIIATDTLGQTHLTWSYLFWFWGTRRIYQVPLKGAAMAEMTKSETLKWLQTFNISEQLCVAHVKWWKSLLSLSLVSFSSHFSCILGRLHRMIISMKIPCMQLTLTLHKRNRQSLCCHV